MRFEDDVFLYIDVSGIVLSPAARLPPHADLDLPLSPSQEAGARLVERLAVRQRAFSLTASDACLALLLGAFVAQPGVAQRLSHRGRVSHFRQNATATRNEIGTRCTASERSDAAAVEPRHL